MQKLIKVTEIAIISLVVSVFTTGAALANAEAAHGEAIITKSTATLVAHEPIVPGDTVIAPEPAAPAYVAGLALLDAARAQLGVHQDCTALVENALRAIGFSVADLGPMDFQWFGTQVAAEDAQPGDIMMRWGHVAIYAGNDAAVQGGFNGNNTVETTTEGSPYRYAIIIRLP